jgi:hypothetical protein
MLWIISSDRRPCHSFTLLEEIKGLIARHAGQPVPIDGLRVSKIEAVEPDHSLTEPLLVTAAMPAAGRPSRTAGGAPAIAAGEASPELLDAVARMLRLARPPRRRGGACTTG